MDKRKQLNKKNTAIALGNFDGLHLGHQGVLSNALESGYSPVAMVIRCPFTIMTKHHMEQVLNDMGLQSAFLDFERIRDMDGAAFVRQILIKEWNAAVICCGYNFHFGRGGQWDAVDLKKFCDSMGIRLIVSPQIYTTQGGTISSTQIRDAIRRGDMPAAKAMLGRPYSYTFTVVQGDQRGRTIGVPTINQRLDSAMTAPKFGVYASQSNVEGKWYKSITNIGIRPTYRLDVPQSETHIIGYQGDLYGKQVTVALVAYLREEVQFDSLDALKRQIHTDMQQAYLAGL